MPARHPYHNDLESTNRLLTEQSRDNVRNRLLIGQAAPLILYPPSPLTFFNGTFVLARYPYNPAFHVWTQMHIYVETDTDPSGDADRIDLDFRYTLDNGATFPALALNNTGDHACGVLWREATVDLSGLTAATWVGAAVRATLAGAGAKNLERVICRAMVFLERPGF